MTGNQGTSPTIDSSIYRRVFVGREAELQRLVSTYERAVGGEGSLAMVAGEPGIGKTALCEQLTAYVQARDGTTLLGHCYEEGSLSLPYLPFVEALQDYISTHDTEAIRAVLGTGASDVARIVPLMRERLQVDLRAPGEPADDLWQLMQAVTQFLRAAAAVRPILLVLEDLHWADRATLDLLQHLARGLAGSRLLLVGTYRDVEVDRSHPLAGSLAELRRAASFERIVLRGLSADEVHRMYEAVRGNDVPLVQAELVHRQTEGNPLFVQEVLRYLVEQGIVVLRNGLYVRTDDRPVENLLPEGLRDVVGKRLSLLSDRTNQALSIAAVAGRDFNLKVLLRVARLTEDEVIEAIEESIQIGVLEERATPGVIQYRFTHAFFRQALYEEMSAARRLRYHQQIGRVLEELYAGRLEDHAVELAEHFTNSTDAADLSKAVTYNELAAQRAMSVFAYGEAARHLEQALQVQDVLDPDDHARRCDLLIALGGALLPLDEVDRVVGEVAPAALATAEALGERERAFAACDLALSALIGRPSETSVRWAEIAEPYVGDDLRARIRLNRAQSFDNTHAGHWDTAVAQLREALSLSRDIGDANSEFGAAWELILQAKIPPEEELSLIQELAAKPKLGVGIHNLALFYVQATAAGIRHGDRDKAEAASKELRRISTETHYRSLEALATAFEWRFAALDGLLPGPGERVPDAGVGTAIGAAFRAYAARLRGDSETVEAMITWFEYSTFRKSVAYQPLLLAALGRFEEAKLALATAAQDILDLSSQGYAGTAHLKLLLEGAVILKEVAIVRQILPMLTRWPASPFDDDHVATARLYGDAASLVARPTDARAFYEQAIEDCVRLHCRPELALTQLSLAELLQQHYPNERADALALLDVAIAELGGDEHAAGAGARSGATAGSASTAQQDACLSGRSLPTRG